VKCAKCLRGNGDPNVRELEPDSLNGSGALTHSDAAGPKRLLCCFLSRVFDETFSAIGPAPLLMPANGQVERTCRTEGAQRESPESLRDLRTARPSSPTKARSDY
jgi:hypothetical protein